MSLISDRFGRLYFGPADTAANDGRHYANASVADSLKECEPLPEKPKETCCCCPCCCQEPSEDAGGDSDQVNISAFLPPYGEREVDFWKIIHGMDDDTLAQLLHSYKKREADSRKALEDYAAAHPDEAAQWPHSDDRRLHELHRNWKFQWIRLKEIQQELFDRGYDPDIGKKVIGTGFDPTEFPTRAHQMDPVDQQRECPIPPAFLELRARGLQLPQDEWWQEAGAQLANVLCEHQGRKVPPLHLWINMRDRHGVYWLVEGGTETPLRTWVEENKQRPGGVPVLFDGSGLDIEAAVEMLKSSKDIVASNPAAWDYNPLLGPNSSTFVAEALKRAGVPLEAPPCAIGWSSFSPSLSRK